MITVAMAGDSGEPSSGHRCEMQPDKLRELAGALDDAGMVTRSSRRYLPELDLLHSGLDELPGGAQWLTQYRAAVAAVEHVLTRTSERWHDNAANVQASIRMRVDGDLAAASDFAGIDFAGIAERPT